MIRVEDYELRVTETVGEEIKKYLEIVKWEGDTCYTLASFKTDKDGDFPSLEYCEDRPLQKDIDKEIFDKLVIIGYNIYKFREIPNEELL